MKNSLVARVALLLLIASTLSGCLWVVDDDQYGRGGGGRGDGSHGGGGHGGGGHRDGGDRH